jgi:hypothetical protein
LIDSFHISAAAFRNIALKPLLIFAVISLFCTPTYAAKGHPKTSGWTRSLSMTSHFADFKGVLQSDAYRPYITFEKSNQS